MSLKFVSDTGSPKGWIGAYFGILFYAGCLLWAVVNKEVAANMKELTWESTFFLAVCVGGKKMVQLAYQRFGKGAA